LHQHARATRIHWRCRFSITPNPATGTDQLESGALYAGSEIYYTADSDEEIDITLFLLDEEPPDGTVYSGWTTAGQSGNDDVTVLHHPAGDYMRISFGASSPSGRSAAITIRDSGK
jgi:hypothetical protein